MNGSDTIPVGGSGGTSNNNTHLGNIEEEQSIREDIPAFLARVVSEKSIVYSQFQSFTFDICLDNNAYTSYEHINERNSKLLFIHDGIGPDTSSSSLLTSSSNSTRSISS
ncbi:hypothetical protein DFA_09997 [Cavenderia fasciculata]|uniref:Uncharacterized protein n=1 Tax=Cavenderia fasciculata TaxID=261658 RepID=F4Q902_CACFS|nr:uncharacterized protein DFA_09997 [Cavenderia fasciculata]EGG15171.1 hypothetical protein DFA_09997 [Cavenderia fasciculata]|eukprot:XP_004351891.1 hypothetical protein DFA_09997 [Cavenderia fasciculata]